MSKERMLIRRDVLPEQSKNKTVVMLKNVGITKGAETIFENVSLTISASEHVALVGPNGAGKTTLLEVLTGDQIPDTGTGAITKGTRVSYVPQSIEKVLPKEQGGTVLDYLYAGRELNIILKRMREIENLLEADTNVGTDALLHEYGELQEAFEFRRGYTIEEDAEIIMRGIGLPENINLSTPINQLSGGEKTKLFLIQALVANADLLLLDEPSNHLDPESVTWLIEYLSNYEGSLLVVSHQPEFLNSIANRVVEMTNNGIRDYSGTYSDFLIKREQIEEVEERKQERFEKEVERLTEVINRLRVGNRATTSKDRQRKLNKLIAEAPARGGLRKNVKGGFEIQNHSGKNVLRTSNLVKRYGDKQLDYTELRLELERGDMVAIVGPVGVGKSTLLKIIAGVLEPDTGNVMCGHNVDIGYYSQEMEDLNLNNNVLNEIGTVSPGMREQQVRSFLGTFIFSGDDVFKQVSSLSYGERSRLMLAKLALSKHNFLVLDEPTNHLDVETRVLLASKLNDYEGTTLLVSHDEEFLSDLNLNRIISLPNGEVTWL